MGGLIFLAVSVLFLWSGEKDLALKGKSASNLISKNGQFLFIFKKSHHGLQLASRSSSDQAWKIKDILSDPQARFPALKKDREGQIWALWEQGKGVSIGKLQEKTLVLIQRYQEGSQNITPDITFDLDNTPWLTWVCFFQGKSFILAQNFHSKKTWVVNSSFFSESSSPQIVVDHQNHPWVFWAGRKKGRDQIFYSSFDGRDWSEPEIIHRKSPSPHILPHAGVDSGGNIWVVWSAYDGNDYEIYCSLRNQTHWTAEEKITDNSYPDWGASISFLRGNIPVVVWKQGPNRLSCQYQIRGSWSQELPLYEGNRSFSAPPLLSTHKEVLTITLEADERIIHEFFSFRDLTHPNHFSFPSFSPDRTFSSSKPEGYIGFGDSITFGYLDGEEAPEKGYIPRLESRLQQYYGPSQVINEGFPAEITIQGLHRIKEVISSHSAKFLLLMEGTNDVIFRDISMDTTAFNLERMILLCQNSGVFPLLSTIPPRKDWEWNFKYYRERIFSLNDKIRRIGEALNIPLVDHFQVFYSYPEEKGGWKSLLCKDGVHPSVKGYKIMAHTWFEKIKTLPFPPFITQIERIYDQILFFKHPGNSIHWKDNPKLSSRDIFSGYKIYRAEASGPPFDFHLLTILQNPLQKSFFDTDILPSQHYVYALSTLRRDGTEGPLSKPFEETKDGGSLN